ncbi:hypothetical protein B0H14DRAFT_2712260 [Mycena olivaceomarginata]|nr:hypothetical protein B0H14DRAFT_2712260 [Mycena olivaceomarginata]
MYMVPHTWGTPPHMSSARLTSPSMPLVADLKCWLMPDKPTTGIAHEPRFVDASPLTGQMNEFIMGGSRDTRCDHQYSVSKSPSKSQSIRQPRFCRKSPLPKMIRRAWSWIVSHFPATHSLTLPDNQGNAAISVVDFSPFLDGSNKQGVADEILSSFKRVGFVYLLNHGLPQERIAKMFAVVSRVLFARPRNSSRNRRRKSFQPTFNGEGEIRAAVPDVKEHFECGREDDADRPNIWLPDGVLPGFKENCLEFYWLCHEVEMNVLRALAVGFGLAEDYFTQYHRAADNQLRLLHYPRVPAEAIRNGSVGRITAHSDYASLTLLLQDDIGGLEIEDPKVAGLFRPAPPITDALIVNAGDFMMRWSNDTIRSTVHRVRAPPACETSDGTIPERYSIPYDRNTILECVPGTWDAENPKKYEPISASEYTRKRLAAAY